MLSVGVCTHNPRSELLTRVIDALARQTVKAFKVVIIDNACEPPLEDSLLERLRRHGVSGEIVREERPGLLNARLRAIDATSSDWMLCVDDDNILASNYVAEGFDFIDRHPDVAAFGGKLILPAAIHPPHGTTPFLPFLAIRDLGNEVLKGVSNTWQVWEPPAAGAFVKRAALEDYREFVRGHPIAIELGRTPTALGSCEDSLLMHSAFRIGQATAYNPRLRLEHHLDLERFELSRLVKLMEGYGRSQAILRYLLDPACVTPLRYVTPVHVALTVAASSVKNLLKEKSPSFAYAMAKYHLAAARTYGKLYHSSPSRTD